MWTFAAEKMWPIEVVKKVHFYSQVSISTVSVVNVAEGFLESRLGTQI